MVVEVWYVGIVGECGHIGWCTDMIHFPYLEHGRGLLLPWGLNYPTIPHQQPARGWTLACPRHALTSTHPPLSPAQPRVRFASVWPFSFRNYVIELAWSTRIPLGSLAQCAGIAMTRGRWSLLTNWSSSFSRLLPIKMPRRNCIIS